jgi:putative flippase GtrA
MILQQAVRYAMVGLINTAVGLGCMFFVMAILRVNIIIANMFGYSIGFLVSYYLNRKWTFKHYGNVENSLFRFFVVVISAYGVNLMAVVIANYFFKINMYVSQTIGVIIYALIGFFGSRYFAFYTKNIVDIREVHKDAAQ